MWLEAPLAPESAGAHAALANAISTPLAIGESYRTVFELEPFFAAGAMKYVQPDLGRTGITEGLRIARAAEARGISVVPHVSIALGPQIAAAVHFAAAVPNCPMLEFKSECSGDGESLSGRSAGYGRSGVCGAGGPWGLGFRFGICRVFGEVAAVYAAASPKICPWHATVLTDLILL